jgi:hypothetical protein
MNIKTSNPEGSMGRVMHRKLNKACRTRSMLALLACAITGCATAQEVQQANERQCLSYGFRQATSDFAQCMQRESLAERYLPGGPHPYYLWW